MACNKEIISQPDSVEYTPYLVIPCILQSVCKAWFHHTLQNSAFLPSETEHCDDNGDFKHSFFLPTYGHHIVTEKIRHCLCTDSICHTTDVWCSFCMLVMHTVTFGGMFSLCKQNTEWSVSGDSTMRPNYIHLSIPGPTSTFHVNKCVQHCVLL